MKPTVIYSTLHNYDKTEGRGPMSSVGYFANREDAERARAGGGIMGIPGRDKQDTQVKEIVIHQTFDDWVRSLDPKSDLAKIHRPAIDKEYAQYLELHKKFG